MLANFVTLSFSQIDHVAANYYIISEIVDT